MTAVPAQFADLWGSDRQRQNDALTALMAETSDPVAWAGAAWPEVVANLTHRDNHNRAIAAQTLIGAEPDLKYRRKYAGHWKGHLPV